MTTHEYRILAGPTPTELEKQLNELAAEGWELASMACCGSIGPLIVLVLRRPRSGAG